jgi:23S rRNA pseudouridine2605 synthase
VTRLIRVSFGPFQLEDLGIGAAEEVRTRTLRDQLGPRLIDQSDAWLDGPRRDPVQATSLTPERAPRRFDKRKPSEKRDKAVLGEAPDLRVTREKVADRKGRAVKVERIVKVEAPAPDIRQEERRPRRDDNEWRPRRDDADRPRPPRTRDGDDRPRARTPRPDGDRPGGPRDGRGRPGGAFSKGPRKPPRDRG